MKNATMNARVPVSKGSIGAFCRKHGVRRLAVFGSALRDDFGPTSDIDVLVEFAPDRIPGLLGVAGMEAELSRLFLGRKVDLRTPEDLSPISGRTSWTRRKSSMRRADEMAFAFEETHKKRRGGHCE